MTIVGTGSLRSEDPVTGISQTRDDICALVELFIESGAVHGNIGMLFLDAFESRRSSYDADHTQIFASACLQEVESGAGASAGSEHRIKNEHDALSDIIRHLAVVLYGLMRIGITVHTDVSDSCGREEFKNAVYHSETSPKDRYEGNGSISEDLEGCSCDRSFDLLVDEGEILGHFIDHQFCQLIGQLTEILGVGVLVSHKRELVLDQRMFEDEGVSDLHTLYLL
jgi:hypothetical protein